MGGEEKERAENGGRGESSVVPEQAPHSIHRMNEDLSIYYDLRNLGNCDGKMDVLFVPKF